MMASVGTCITFSILIAALAVPVAATDQTHAQEQARELFSAIPEGTASPSLLRAAP